MIWVTPLSTLSDVLAQTKAGYLLSLLSVDAESHATNHLPRDRCLHLYMNDIAEPREGLVAPSPAHVAQIIEFGLQWDRKTPMVVHCYAGISRSTAAAYVIAAALQPDKDEQDLADELRRLSPSATPNPLIVSHADLLLGRQGRMIEAIRRIGRGADAVEGKLFKWVSCI